MYDMRMTSTLWAAVGMFAGTVFAADSVTFHKQVEPILQKNCQSCHRPGQIAPFALTSYQEAAGWAATIREVVDQGRMPPWNANPKHGKMAPCFDSRRKLFSVRLYDAGAISIQHRARGLPGV